MQAQMRRVSEMQQGRLRQEKRQEGLPEGQVQGQGERNRLRERRDVSGRKLRRIRASVRRRIAGHDVCGGRVRSGYQQLRPVGSVPLSQRAGLFDQQKLRDRLYRERHERRVSDWL
jgi:hypothetical protein